MSNNQTEIYASKLKRIRNGESIRSLDLFAGCGGLSLGFHLLGFNIAAAIEIDKEAMKTFTNNFFKDSSTQLREVYSKPRDITQTDPDELLQEFGISDRTDMAIDIILGGPPCQAFARVGRAKLREIEDHPEAYLKDPRGNLYLQYLKYVKELSPLAIVIENVPDVLNYGGHNIAEEICEVLETWGYVCKYTLLNSVYYGVPQMRERMFLIAYHQQVTEQVEFPEPTHWLKLPQGYEGSRQVALQTVKMDLFSRNGHYLDTPRVLRDHLTPAISAEDALGDLPPITSHLEGLLKRGTRRFTDLARYRNSHSLNAYQEKMRNWPGFENNEGVYDHVIRYLPRDYQIFSRMNPGDQYPQAYKHAIDLLNENIIELRNTGRNISIDSQEYLKLKSEIVPPYDVGKFPNKWRKMERHLPARTLMAHLGKDSYSHIHYDSDQARTISVREAARLQSFPDGFIFSGAMNSAFRQIGNAVPPLMSAALAEPILKSIRGIK